MCIRDRADEEKKTEGTTAKKEEKKPEAENTGH
jgi:hypothetical protein